MRVRLALDVDEQARYIIAQYYKPVDPVRTKADKTRRRATRKQVTRFVLAALRTAIREQAHELPALARTIARRLGDPAIDGEVLAEPKEKQRTLAW